MKAITLHRLALQFDACQNTHGTMEQQARQAIELINQTLARDPVGLSAQLIAEPDEIEVESTDSPCLACDDKGWVQCNTGNDAQPRFQIQRCDACEKYDNDEQARQAAAQAGEPVGQAGPT